MLHRNIMSAPWLGPIAAPEIAGKPGYANTAGRVQVPTTVPEVRTKSLLVFGQSNAVSIANDTSYVPAAGALNFNFYDGKVYAAKDPLLGAETAGGDVLGALGSSWATRLASKMVSAGMADRVVVANCAIGATAISTWDVGGALDGRLAFVVRAMLQAGLVPDYILQMQGESDASAGTSTASYAAGVRSIVNTLRKNGTSAPYFVTQTSLIAGATTPNRNAVRQGQADACSDSLGIFLGPDSDVLAGATYRQADGTHLNVAGIDAHADQWLTVIEAWEATH